ncbi:MAG TPA: hypothetical protein VMF09_00730 [Solirubrobacteraceae bacterium]|nr:hypothetical protein [Solirubrobacteraceae bacterium]
MPAKAHVGSAVVGLAVAVCALVASALASSAAFADWSFPEAGQLNATGSSVAGFAAASVAGKPYIAYVQQSAGATSLIVERWSASAWTQVGEAVGTTPEGSTPALAEVGGVPYVAIPEGGAIHVYELNGGAWTLVGSAVGSELASEPSLASVGGQPCVAFKQGNSEETKVYAYCRSGTTWDKLGNPLLASAGGRFAGYPAVVDDGGEPLLAWDQGTFYGLEQEVELFSALWTGSSWSESGPLNVGAGTSVDTPFFPEETAPALIMDGATPYVAFAEENASQTSINAYVKSFDGTDWSQAGEALGKLSSGDSAQMPALGVFEGEPLALSLDGLTSGEHELTAKTFDGSSWSMLGGRLGAPPLTLEEAILTPAALVEGSGTPWAFFVQESESNAEGEFKLNLYAEDYTAGGVDPIGAGGAGLSVSDEPPTEATETITSTVAEGGSSASSQSAPAASAVLELLGAPSLSGRSKLKLNSGIAVYCPPGEGSCAGTVTLTADASASAAHSSAARLKSSFTVAAGDRTNVTLALSKSLAKLVRASGRLKGSVTVKAAGSNGEASELAQAVAVRLSKRSARS